MALARQFVVSPELQQLLAGFNSRAVANVVLSFVPGTQATTLPSSSPTALRRSLYFSSVDRESATPTEFDLFIQNVNGTHVTQMTVPR